VEPFSLFCSRALQSSNPGSNSCWHYQCDELQTWVRCSVGDCCLFLGILPNQIFLATVLHSVNLFSGCISCWKTTNMDDRDKCVRRKNICYIETSADVWVDVSFALFIQTIRILVSYLLSLLTTFVLHSFQENTEQSL
jgi:hypothetical protein